MKITINDKKLFRKLDDIIPSLDSELIDTYFKNNFSNNMQELLTNIMKSPTEIFIEYVVKSSNKALSTLVKSYIYRDEIQLFDNYYILSNNAIRTICLIIESRYFDKWTKLYNTLNLEYNPIKPYSMTVEEQGTESMNTKSTISTETQDSVTSTEDTNSSGVNDYNKYGFNSETSVPTDKDNIINDVTSENSSSSTGSRSTDSTYDRTKPYEKSITRDGNIGNITQQELIEKERELLQYQIIDTIFRDIDGVITRSKYI